jgi:hypothetical protein
MRRDNSRFQVTLVLGKEGQSLLTKILCLQDSGSKDLHRRIIRVILSEILGQLQGGVGLARDLLGQGLDSGQVGGIFFTGDGSEHLSSLTKGDLGAELEHTSRELVLGGEGGGLKVDHLLVLAGVEGIVDVEEL